MPVNKIALGAITGILLGASIGYFSQPNETKPGLMDQLRPRLAVHAQKPNQSLSATIQNLQDLPDDPAQELRLQITVSANRHLDGDTDLQLRLPAGVQLVSGLDARERLQLEPGATWTREFTVRGVSNQAPVVIKAELAAQIDGVPIGGEGFFSSHPLQADLSRKPLPKREDRGFFRKAGTEAPAAAPRLPAGIQF
ncbi:MAG: hypothetical protein KF767_03705 [Bdellovibrionaceae bacterium]|nr:hypothetical protein [Pseudobdellovibrionaceae bacterium]